MEDTGPEVAGGDRRMKGLILFPHYLWHHKMSVVRRSAIRAMLRSDLLDVNLTGQGWPDWVDSLPVQTNIERLKPDAEFVFSYKSQGMPKRGVPRLVDLHNARVLRVESFNECHDPSIIRDAVRAGTQLAILHLANSVHDWRDTDVATCVIPHCAETRTFAAAARPWEERDIHVLLTGTLAAETYPLRCRLANLIRTGKIPGVIHPHPGNYLPSLEACDRQELEYAELLGRTKISLGCTSLFRYRLARIPEHAMSGCCVISDFPDESPKIHGQFIWGISNKMSDVELCDQVSQAILDDDTTRKLARRGQQMMVQHYAMEHYTQRFSASVRERLSC